VRDFKEVVTGMTAFANSENTIICHAELVSASRSKNRWTLGKAEKAYVREFAALTRRRERK